MCDSTVTLFAKLRGWSTLAPRSTAMWYASSCSGMLVRVDVSMLMIPARSITAKLGEKISCPVHLAGWRDNAPLRLSWLDAPSPEATMHRNAVRVFALLAVLSATAPAAHAQLSGETRESARPVFDEGVPRGQGVPIAPPPPPPGVAVAESPTRSSTGVRWTIGSAGRIERDATGVGASATMVMTGATKFELRGEYSRRSPDGLNEIDGVGGQLKLFLPESWSPPGVSVAGSAEGAREFDVGSTWAVKGAADVNVTRNVIVGFTGAYHEKQPEGGSTVSGFVPSTSLAVIPATGTEVSLQYRLDNDYHGEDRTELAVSHTFPLARDRWIRVRGSVAKHGTLSVGLSFRP
jgi:hypothetical protein